jgi:HK97 family phage portal protein
MGFVALHLQAEASWTRRDYGALAREGFMRNPVAHRSVRLISEAAASVPLLLYEGAAELAAHPLLELLERPNPRQPGAAFLEALYGHLLLSGNAYVERVETAGGGRELHLLRPDRVSLACDAAGWPEALEHRVGGARRRIPLGDDGRALHLRLFHPLDDHYGFPPLEAALTALDTHNASGRWNKALLDNSARPSGALVYAPKDGTNLTDEQYDRLKAELEHGYSGVARAGRPLLLEGGLDWKAMGLTPKDMDFVEARNGAARDIALAFGVPPMLLGIRGDNTYANYVEANRAFYRLTILPLVGRTLRELTAFLAPGFGAALRLWYDADAIEGLSAERDALWARVGQAGFLSDEEKRQAVGYGAELEAGEKAGFRVDQPRVPRGRSDGGRWTDGGVAAEVVPVQARTTGSRGGGRQRMISGRMRRVTPAEEALIEISQAQMDAAIARVRQVEPDWRPRDLTFETPRGLIEANNSAREEALARYTELQDAGVAPGRFAVEWQPARGPKRNWTAEEIRENNRIGERYGCHTCGAKDSGRPNVRLTIDHQPANALNFNLREQILLPHCLLCIWRQGAWIRNYRRRHP